MVPNVEKTCGVIGYDSVSEEFVNLVESLKLQNLPLHGDKFTFFKSGWGNARSRLDRFIVKKVNLVDQRG